jgi:hypothetical protein
MDSIVGTILMGRSHRSLARVPRESDTPAR